MDADDVREVSGEMHSSELTLGRWIRARGCRDDVVVCTKVNGGNAPENIARAVRDCSERLGINRIDIFMLHVPDDKVPIDESLDALNAEVSAGRVGIIGCSNFSGGQLREALEASRRHNLARFEVIENHYNLVHREAETDVFPVCAERDVSFIAFSPLGAGFLTGKYTRDRQQLPPGTRFDVIPGHCDVYFSDDGFRVAGLPRLSRSEGRRNASGSEAEFPDLAAARFPGRVHAAHSTEGLASDSLLWLVLQQVARGAEEA